MADMDIDLFAQQDYGKAALSKLSPVVEDFRLFDAGWLGDKPEEMRVMKVVGAQFRRAKTGKNAGKLTIKIPGTTRNVYLTKDEIKTFKSAL